MVKKLIHVNLDNKMYKDIHTLMGLRHDDQDSSITVCSVSKLINCRKKNDFYVHFLQIGMDKVLEEYKKEVKKYETKSSNRR